MGRFYFDVRDGETFTPDDEGLELPGIKEARDDASRSLAEIQGRHAGRNTPEHGCRGAGCG